jgi:hypothetical protein
MGEVRDLSAARRSGLEVRGAWSRMTVAQGVSGRQEYVVVDTTDARGRFTLCGVPSDGEVEQRDGVTRYGSGTIALQAGNTTLASGVIAVQLGGAVLRRRDLIVGTAQDIGRIQGRVLDPLGKPIPDATVVLGGVDGPTTRTDSLGRWALDRVRTHSTELAIRALGFTPEVRELDPLGGRLTGGEIRLQRAPQVLETVNIRGIATSTTAAGFEERKRTYGFGSFLDEATLKQQAVVTAEFVASRTPRVRAGNGELGIEQAGSGMSAMTICSPRWFVDGVDFGKLPGDEQRALLLRAVRIEIYRASLSPPQFNDFDGCGVVVVWTR